MVSERVGYAIELGISCIVVALLVPTGVGLIINATFSGADSTVVLMWQILLPTFIMLGLALAFMPASMKAKVGLWSTPYSPNIPTNYTYAQPPRAKTTSAQIHETSNFEGY